MQRSSHEIGALAAALAKAQAEIENPSKSLTATIESPFPREGQRSFRYAPLSAGLDIVRKCLSRHEIATLQATAIDDERGLIRLMTTLVHASGEWMSSDWPVCPISETAAPHRLGAALTYARRYSLFTMVGIAGEDDIDAPDFASLGGSAPPSTNLLHQHQSSGKAAKPDLRVQMSKTASRSPRAGGPKPAPLAADASAELQDRLILELKQVEPTNPNALTAWAQRSLPLKNEHSLTDAQAVELAFDAALAPQTETAAPWEPWRTESETKTTTGDVLSDKVIMIDKPVRERDRHHLRFVASQPCLICGRSPSDAHHVKFAQGPALGRKVSDRFTVPLCRLHHRDLHRRGNERTWWKGQRIDPLAVASMLWRNTHALEGILDDAGEPARSPTDGEPLGTSSLARLNGQD
jgi:hypothetical protein